MHLSSVIPANDTRESVFGHRNSSRREQESNLGPLAPEECLTTELPRFHACRLSHDIQIISNPYITFYYLFELITKIRFSNNTGLIFKRDTIIINHLLELSGTRVQYLDHEKRAYKHEIWSYRISEKPLIIAHSGVSRET